MSGLKAQDDWSAAAEREANYIRRADGRLEQVCEHGVGHTVAIDRVRYYEAGVKTYDKTSPRWREVWWSHGCDGCCDNMERLHE